MIRFQYCIALLCALFSSSEVVAIDTQDDECVPYFTSVFDSNKSISYGLLEEGKRLTAIKCLVQALKKLSPDVVSPDIEESKRGALNRTAAALLRIVDKGGFPSIQEIRKYDDISVASVLAFGSRNDDRETRLNSMNLLSNIIDNSTVCVPMDHLADPDIGINGRANLIAVVSVVAPWAQQSNFNNMKRLVEFLKIKIEEQEDVQKTNELIKTLIDRLDYQDTIQNPNKNTETSIMDECRNMPAKWANTPQFTLDYTGNNSTTP